MSDNHPGIFSAHSGTQLRFFDKVGDAQDWAEKYPEATIRRDYGKGWTDIAKWSAKEGRWSYIHRKTPKTRAKTKTRR
jgi:hypothetical protein